MGSAANRNSDGWQKCFTNVPPGASRGSADHNVKNVLAASAMPTPGDLHLPFKAGLWYTFVMKYFKSIVARLRTGCVPEG